MCKQARVSWLRALPLLVVLAACAPASATTPQAASVTREQVARVLERLRAGPPDDAGMSEAVHLGNLLLGEARFAEAEQLYKALLERRPREPAALYGAALAAFNLGRATEAEPLVREAANIWSASARSSSREVSEMGKARAADALVLLGVILAVRGDDAHALEAVERAVAFAPAHFDAQFALGRARYGAGDPSGAARAFRAAVALRPLDARARFFLATALEGAGDDAGALAAYRELVASKPDVAEGHLGLGVLLVKRGGAGVEEGIAALARAVQLNPDLYEARVTLGRALVMRGRAAESVEHLRRAAQLAPGNPEPHYQLSIAYRRLGRRQEADRESAIVKRIHESRRTGDKQPD